VSRRRSIPTIACYPAGGPHRVKEHAPFFFPPSQCEKSILLDQPPTLHNERLDGRIEAIRAHLLANEASNEEIADTGDDRCCERAEDAASNCASNDFAEQEKDQIIPSW